MRKRENQWHLQQTERTAANSSQRRRVSERASAQTVISSSHLNTNKNPTKLKRLLFMRVCACDSVNDQTSKKAHQFQTITESVQSQLCSATWKINVPIIATLISGRNTHTERDRETFVYNKVMRWLELGSVTWRTQAKKPNKHLTPLCIDNNSSTIFNFPLSQARKHTYVLGKKATGLNDIYYRQWILIRIPFPFDSIQFRAQWILKHLAKHDSQ